ncbi:magnesium chelatase [Comamonadaceae bacterium OH2545_COT-014]|nr:magnesium chelatase [Comamonadaceae bacterium OH2545_COT-014]
MRPSPDAPAAALPAPYPFAAITGQPRLTQALLLAATDPALGGVLIEGPRGTAKSTAARALAALMAPAPFVTVPLGASLEHLTGTLDLNHALAGHAVRFAPGLLARAHGGVLYVDEINLLPDALVDALLDAAASGINVVERDGISHAHPARFVLIGTMNPEEGELRPQLLDRLGLCVRLANVHDAAQRQAIVKARLAFDADPAAFAARHASAQAALAARLARARALAQDPAALPLPDDVHHAASQRCVAARVDGLRADLVMLRAARALAAWENAPAVTPQHVAQVADMVLDHRRHPDAETPPTPPAPDPTAAPADAPASSHSPSDAAPPPPSSSLPEGDWGALPPEPVGIVPAPAFKPLRPLSRPPPAKKA